MVKIDLEAETQRERSLYSAAQSVESLVITANEGILRSDSKPRTSKQEVYLSKDQIEEHHHIKDLDVMESNETPISDDEIDNRNAHETLSENELAERDDKDSLYIKSQKIEDPIDGPISTMSKGSEKYAIESSDRIYQDTSSIQSAKRSGSIGKKSDSRSYSVSNNNASKPETVRFSKSANSIIPSSENLSVNLASQRSAMDSNESKENIVSESQIDNWPASQELPKKSYVEKQRVRLPPDSDEESDYKSRSRGKSDVGSMKNARRKQTGRKSSSGVIDALDLEEMGVEKRAKIRKDVDTSELGSREGFKRSPPQQKSKKAKHRGRVEPAPEDHENNYDEDGYNSDGPNFGSYHQKARASSTKNNQIYQQTNGSPPLLHNSMPANYQQMLMYGYRPQDQFQYQPHFMQPEFMMQQPVWNGQPNSAPWMPVMAPQNFGYQYFPQNPPSGTIPAVTAVMPIASSSLATSAPIEKEVVEIQSKISAASPPPKTKSHRKVEPFPVTDSSDLANPITAILVELSGASQGIPMKQEPQSIIVLEGEKQAEKQVEKQAEKESKRSNSNILEESNTTPVVHSNPTNLTNEEISSAVISPIIPTSFPIASITSQQEVSSTIRQNASAPPIPYIVSQEVEQQRLAAMHALGIVNIEDHPRLTKITQMTSRLLGRSCCVLSLVDTDKVIWKSVYPPITSVREEPRYESFCSWVVQDESGRGVTVLDSKTDPRCTHIRVKPGLEFYAGVPITVGTARSGKHKIGALSIQGPPSAQISVIDMNILHEMAVWASGELETIMIQKTLQDREMYIQARDKLGEFAITSKSSDKPSDMRSLEKSLGLIRNALRANSVLLLKLSPETKGFQSVLQAYSFDPSTQKTSNLLVGEEMFHELCAMTLKKETGDSPLLLENLKTGPVTKEVDQYLSKKINKCMSELLWSTSGPIAVIAAFFDDNYRLITKEDLSFVNSLVPTLSSIFDNLELKDSFQQVSTISKTIGVSLKKQSVVFGKQQGLAPCVVIIEPRLETFKGYDKIVSLLQLDSFSNDHTDEIARSGSDPSPTLSMGGGPKGQAVGQVLAQKQDPIPGGGGILSPVEGRQSETKKIADLAPIESFEILNDFTLLIENLAEKFSLKKPKRLGLHYYLFANYGQDTGSLASAASFAHEIFFAIDTYNQNKRRKLRTRIGIHLDFVSSDISQDSSALKDQIISLVNGAYQLETRADSILTSELFYHQTKQFCSFEPSLYPIIVRGQGAYSTYRLIGITQQSTNPPTDAIQVKENGVNEGANLVTSIVPHLSLPPLQINSNVVLSNGTSVAGVGDGKPIELGGGNHGGGNHGNTVLPLKTTTMVSSPTESKRQKCTIL